jgi:hypothetical protein
VHVSVIEIDDPALDELLAAATGDSHRVVLILGTSNRNIDAELRVEADGAATQQPSGITFRASLVPHALISLDSDDTTLALTAVTADPAPTSEIVQLARTARSILTVACSVLRLFCSPLLDLEPRQAGVGARAEALRMAGCEGGQEGRGVAPLGQH